MGSNANTLTADPDAFMASRQAADPDAFMASRNAAAPGPAAKLQPNAASLPMSAQLPTASDAVAIAEANARMLVNPPPIPNPIPHELRGYTPAEMAERGNFQNPRTGRTSTVGGDIKQLPVLDSPIYGSQKVAEGVEQAAQPGLREKAGGAAKILEGGMNLAEPAMAGAGLVAPVESAVALTSGALAQRGTSAALNKAGVPQEYSDLAGDVAGIAGAGAASGPLRATMRSFEPGARFGKPIDTGTPEVIPPEAAPQTGGLGAGKEPVEASFSREPDPDSFMAGRKEGANSQQPVASSAPDPDAFMAARVSQGIPSSASERGRTAESAGGSPQGGAPDATPASQLEGRTQGMQRSAGEVANPQSDETPSLNDKAARMPAVQPAYGREASVAVPGEATRYPARYAVRDLSDVQASHNASSFLANPDYDYTNDRDYSRSGNATRVIKNSSQGYFDPEFLTTDSPTAEHGSPVIDSNGNALSGNSRTMTLSRVYGRGGDDAANYQQQLAQKAQSFGIDPDELARFKRPVLVRELTGNVDPQRAITDFNKTAAAELTPEERAVSDGRRMSPATISDLSSRLEDLGEEGTLASALRGDDGTEVLQRLVKDGVITEQEKGGYLDDRGGLTPEAKARIGKALVGRLYDNPADFRATTPEMRAKLERVAPHVLRVEDRPGWALTDNLKNAIGLAEDARVHKMNVADQARHDSIWKEDKNYTPETVQMAETLDQSPVKAAAAFRRYANDEALSRPGAQQSMYEPPTQKEAFADAFNPGEMTRAMNGGEEVASTQQPVASSKETPAAAVAVPPAKGTRARSPMVEKRLREIRAKQGERGSVNLGELNQLADEKLGLSEPRTNYSGLTGTLGTEKFPGAAKFGAGKFKDKFIRNLSQLEEAAPAAHEAGVRLATSNAQASALINAAVPEIERTLGKDGPKWEDLRKAYIESRLRGIRERWGKMAAQSSVSTPTQLAHMLDNGGMDLLKDIQEKGDIPQDVAQTAAALRLDADSGHVKAWGTMRDFLRKTFEQAAEATAHVMTPDEFDAVRYHPKFKAADAAYGRLIEQPLNESHARNEGIFSNALGPLNRYHPLVPTEKAEVQQTIGMNRPYKKPENFANQFATGLGEYDTSMKALRDRVVRAFRANNKAAFLQALEDEGLFQRFDNNERRPDTMVFNGVPFKAVPVESRGGRETVKGGKNEYLPAEGGIMPQWLQKEVDPILKAKDMTEPGMLKRALNVVNRIGLSGPTELVMHSHSLVGSLQVAMPFVGKDVLSYVGAAPLAGKFEAIMRVIRTDATSPGAAAEIQEMAKAGWVPPGYGQSTFSKSVAESSGAELHRTSLGPLLYGRNGIDIRTRLALYRMAKAAYPEATPAEMYKFGTWLPNYTWALQSTIERALKNTGLAPFFTAGSTGIKSGIHSVLGTGMLPGSVPGARPGRWLTRGAGGLALAWMIVHKLYRGEWPWEDKKSQLLKIRAKPEDRKSALGKKLWGDGPEDGFINFAFFNPMVGRGVRALGAEGAYNTWRAGGDAGQMREAAMTGALNAFSHPVLGPGARALFAGMTGDEAYVTGLRDRNAKPGLNFLPASKEVDAAPHVGAAVRQMNSFYANLGGATGFGKLDPEYEPKGDRWLKMVTDLAVPQLVGAAANMKGRKDFLKAQQQAEKRIAAKRRSEENRKRAGQ